MCLERLKLGQWWEFNEWKKGGIPKPLFQDGFWVTNIAEGLLFLMASLPISPSSKIAGVDLSKKIPRKKSNSGAVRNCPQPPWYLENIMQTMRARGVLPTPDSPKSHKEWPRKYGSSSSKMFRMEGSTAWTVKSYRSESLAKHPSLARQSRARCTSFSFQLWMGDPSFWICLWIQRICLRFSLSLSPCWMMNSQPASCSSSPCASRPLFGFSFSALKEKWRNWCPPKCSSIHWKPLRACCLLREVQAISKTWPRASLAT